MVLLGSFAPCKVILDSLSGKIRNLDLGPLESGALSIPKISVGKIKWNGPFWFGPTGIFGTSFEVGPLRPVWSFRSVGPKCPFPFGKIVVPSTALLYHANKNNNQTHDGLGGGGVTE